ncbi:enoyl-CoA hydratase/isomerase family protein [Geodermatophilus sp. DSM 44513]|uniref:enoyl-CoA hydratase/isomerase family protein n=1 Tax=Geodermatophilus sp. DSM 44513 TaxID=1528104 RepID=UPI00127EDBF5|nr:enoyl-CoA hydratase/isomerase family protein [Geodermatophilus sp. DSM 44513]WNV74165.1 enoyl-CoA hydratase/isomerase family protein [Geodermatophilus sp. DSM 44513]
MTARPLVQVTRPSAGVAVLTLDSPPRNAFGPPEGEAFLAAFAELEADPAVRCVVVTGTGTAFLAGGDLRLQQTLTTPEQQRAHADHPHGLSAAMRRVEEARVPVVAAVNGDVAGGGLEFALCCDVRLAASTARFVAAGVNVGLILSWYRLPRTIGLGRAKEMLLTGAAYDAATAERWGLVTGVHEPAALLPAAVALAERIASRAPLSVEATKACANRAFDLTTEEAGRLQRQTFLEVFATRDHEEALAAFFERRPPVFERR